MTGRYHEFAKNIIKELQKLKEQINDIKIFLSFAGLYGMSGEKISELNKNKRYVNPLKFWGIPYFN